MQGRSTARTVLIEMANDEARAERISSVIAQRKADDPKYTSRYISDQVGKSERSVNNWKATGALARENSDKLAEVLNVDPVWLWLGRKTETPDVLDMLPGAGPSHQVEEVRDEFRTYVRELHRKLDLIMAALNVRAPESTSRPIVPYPESELPEGDRRAGRADRRAHGTHPRTGSEG